MSHLAVFGAGSWGTALAIVLSTRFDTVALWARRPEQAILLEHDRENKLHLSGFHLPANVRISSEMAAAAKEATVILVAIPSSHLREAMQSNICSFTNTPVISATKGIEQGTLLRMSEVLTQVLPVDAQQVAVLSGPTFAREIAAGEPAAVVVASANQELATDLQELCATSSFRLYTTSDIIGVELSAALKNVIALGAGICRGLGLGSNTVAALVTRGLAEITRLVVSEGGEGRTTSGLAGLGDLVLTATGDLSRNRAVGVQLGRGRSLQEILRETSAVAEGITTCYAAYELGRRRKLSLPIVKQMHAILKDGKDVRTAIRDLMERPLIAE